MLNEGINGLALLYIHPDIEPSVDEVINKFAQKSPRRLELL